VGNKIDTAIDLLKQGKSLKVGDVRLGIDETGGIEIAGWSQYLNLENLTRSVALKELEETKSLFDQMVETSTALKLFSDGKKISYSLYFDDAGKTSITICSESNGELRWYLHLRE
jgi:hypothetical protein